MGKRFILLKSALEGREACREIISKIIASSNKNAIITMHLQGFIDQSLAAKGIKTKRVK